MKWRRRDASGCIGMPIKAGLAFGNISIGRLGRLGSLQDSLMHEWGAHYGTYKVRTEQRLEVTEETCRRVITVKLKTYGNH